MHYWPRRRQRLHGWCRPNDGCCSQPPGEHPNRDLRRFCRQLDCFSRISWEVDHSFCRLDQLVRSFHRIK